MVSCRDITYSILSYCDLLDGPRSLCRVNRTLRAAVAQHPIMAATLDLRPLARRKKSPHAQGVLRLIVAADRRLQVLQLDRLENAGQIVGAMNEALTTGQLALPALQVWLGCGFFFLVLCWLHQFHQFRCSQQTVSIRGCPALDSCAVFSFNENVPRVRIDACSASWSIAQRFVHPSAYTFSRMSAFHPAWCSVTGPDGDRRAAPPNVKCVYRQCTRCRTIKTDDERLSITVCDVCLQPFCQRCRWVASCDAAIKSASCLAPFDFRCSDMQCMRGGTFEICRGCTQTVCGECCRPCRVCHESWCFDCLGGWEASPALGSELMHDGRCQQCDAYVCPRCPHMH